MSNSPPFIAHILVLIVAFDILCGTTSVSALDSPTPLELARIQEYLKKINKPAVKSFEIDGDIIDCVPIDKQPAFDHPLLKDHKIETVIPDTSIFQTDGNEPKTYALRSDGEEPTNYALRRDLQEWSQVEHCPEGTVPIQRTTMEDVLRAKSLSHFAKKQFDLQSSTHEYATARATGTNPKFYGTKVKINLWNPYVEHRAEFSLSQLWVAAGPQKMRNTIEVGWQVYPGIYKDNKTRLFIYWTADGYNKTGCYNLKCPGFVQTNSKVIIGGPIAPVSTYNGVQHEITLYVWKNRTTGHWWLKRDNVTVGYWPSKLLPRLSGYSTSVSYGGEIVNRKTGGKHTQTDMGSGHFAEEGYRKASYFRNIELVNSSNALYSPKSLSPSMTNAKCYDISLSSNSTWGTYFFYGGPGRNPKCP